MAWLGFALDRQAGIIVTLSLTRERGSHHQFSVVKQIMQIYLAQP
jgi:hypothetical protein